MVKTNTQKIADETILMGMIWVGGQICTREGPRKQILSQTALEIASIVLFSGMIKRSAIVLIEFCMDI